MDKSFISRVQELVDKAGGQSALSRNTGLSLGAIQRYLRGGDPSRRALIKLSEAGKVSVNWLVYGRDEPDSQIPENFSMPLYGFADNAEQGWYSEVRYKIGSALEWSDPELFAIAAADRSMSCEGIYEGHVCIVSPNTRPHRGDVVFIRRKDGMAALKIFEGENSEWCFLRGYIDPGKNEKLVSSEEQLKRSAIKQMGPVVMIKRRP
jgi:hypothetical protein